MNALDHIADERGTTLVELLVGLMIGMVVLSALTLVVVVTLHGSSRVSARVEATQKGRIAVANIIEELHSACVAPKVAPIKAESNGTTLVFIHAEGAEGDAVAPHPTLTKISLSEGVLTQYDYAYESGSTSADWVWAKAPTTERRLMTDVAPIAPSSSLFTYYTYNSGTLTPIASGAELGTEQAEAVVQVQVALNTAPTTTPIADSGADSSIQDSAALRLTPPSYSEGALSLPCQ